ncbi:MAG: biotin/lipoyl-binding protein [Chloroflexi bacterium]|nr:biotin/lipoyl-binding protein [Chloroflexota bacterium]
MKYLVSVAGKDYAIDVEPGSAPGSYTVTIDGESREVDLQDTNRSWLHSLILDGQSFEVAHTPGQLDIDGSAFAYELERDLGLQRRVGSGAAAGPARLKAPIPGLVVAVNIAPGDEVVEGQALVIVEAMKMQMELKSPRAGHVAEVSVQAGQEVNQGQVLATIGD